MALSYVNMDQLSNIASQMQSAVPLLQQYLSEFSTGAGNVTKGWSDDENSAIFSQKVSEFSQATTALITEIVTKGFGTPDGEWRARESLF